MACGNSVDRSDPQREGRSRVSSDAFARRTPGRNRCAQRPARSVVTETLESRCLLSVVRPDHIVVVIEQDRASDAIGNVNFPYLNSLASTGLYYSNSHGVTHPSEPNTVALYSGSTQGITDNGRNYSFSGPNLAKSLFAAGLSFAGYSENLPSDGSQVTQAGDSQYPDLYTRNLNAMAQFTDVGTLATGSARPNGAVNRTFGAFQSIPTTDYSTLPTVSFIVPNNLHSTHGSNEAYPWAGSSDEENNDILRRWADAWLHDNLDGYLQWARTHNSLLIVTQDEERWVGGTSQTVTTVVNGDPDLFAPGVNPSYVNHYNVLRTIEDMYGLPRLNNSASAAPLDTDALGRLAPSAATQAATTTTLTSNLNPSQLGQSVTFTATVAAGSGTPTGTVTFKEGTSTLFTASLNASGVATFTTSSLAAGSHSIAAVYGGDANFAPSTSPALTQTVNAPALAATTTSLGTSVNPSAYGQAVTLTATVSASAGSGTPTGSVTFRDGQAVLGSVALDGSGRAQFSTSALAAGSHSITASYGGDATFSPSTSAPVTQTVNPVPGPASTTTAVTSSLNPSSFGQLVTFTALVTAPAGTSGTPAGNVTFKDGSTVLGVATLDASGAATLATNVLSGGSHGITATYGGNAAFLASASPVLTQQVNVPATAPANDNFASRAVLQGTSATAYGTNANATRESGEPRHAGKNGGRSVWWTWTAPASGTVTVDTAGSTFDTLLAVYTGSSVSSLASVASNNNASGVSSSKLTFAATAGRQYQIAVDGNRGAIGAITLRFTLAGTFTAASATTTLTASAMTTAQPPLKTMRVAGDVIN
jgi:hypothetical protein